MLLGVDGISGQMESWQIIQLRDMGVLGEIWLFSKTSYERLAGHDNINVAGRTQRFFFIKDQRVGRSLEDQWTASMLLGQGVQLVQRKFSLRAGGELIFRLSDLLVWQLIAPACTGKHAAPNGERWA